MVINKLLSSSSNGYIPSSRSVCCLLLAIGLFNYFPSYKTGCLFIVWSVSHPVSELSTQIFHQLYKMDNRVIIFLLVTWVTVKGTNTTSGSNWTIIIKVFENCTGKNDSLSCFQQKILNFADRMTQSKKLEIFEGFKFVQDEKNGKNVNDLTSKDSGRSLSDEIWQKLGIFFKTHNIELNIPKFYEFNPEEGKLKLSKKNNLFTKLISKCKTK